MHHSHTVILYLNSQDSKDDEESATDEDNVADGFERREESLDDELESGSPVDDSQRSERPDQTKDAEDVEDFAALAEDHGHQGVDDGDQDQRTVHDVPARLEVGVFAVKQPRGDSLCEWR